MFHKDFHLLNEIYNQKIVKENLGLGPEADNQSVTPTPSKIQSFKAPVRKCGSENEEGTHCPYAAKGCDCSECEECHSNQKNEDCEDCGGIVGGMKPQDGMEETEKNEYMSKQLLFRIFKLSAMLHDIIRKGGNVEAWVLSKLTNAHDDLESVFDYKDYEAARSQMEMMGVEENNEEDLYKAIANGGDSLVSQLRTVLKKESRETLEKVLLETIVLLENKS
jgi:hypothetical protein